MGKRYSPEVIANCKKLYVYDNWSFKKISDFYEGSPHHQTVQNWAEEYDWEKDRTDYVDSIIHQITPKQIEQLYLKRIYEVLSDPGFTPKDSDALRKLQLDFRDITDPASQLPVVYAMLSEFIDYIKKYHSAMLTESLLNLFRDFKNYQRSKLTDQA